MRGRLYKGFLWLSVSVLHTRYGKFHITFYFFFAFYRYIAFITFSTFFVIVALISFSSSLFFFFLIFFSHFHFFSFFLFHFFSFSLGFVRHCWSAPHSGRTVHYARHFQIFGGELREIQLLRIDLSAPPEIVLRITHRKALGNHQKITRENVYVSSVRREI